MIHGTAPVFHGATPNLARRKGGIAKKEKNARGGQRKSLKALDSDKEIKGNQSVFLGFPLRRLGWTLLDLAFAWSKAA
jgi:hypothetical protein